MCVECNKLTREIELLRERITNLQAVFAPTWEAPPELRLTPAQERILGCFLKYDRACNEDMLLHASRSTRSAEIAISSNLINVQISHMRKKLEPFGLKIVTVWAKGYRLDPASRARLLNWNAEQTTQVAA